MSRSTYYVHKCSGTDFAIIRDDVTDGELHSSYLKKYSGLAMVFADAALITSGITITDIVLMSEEWVRPLEWVTLFELWLNEDGVWQLLPQ